MSFYYVDDIYPRLAPDAVQRAFSYWCGSGTWPAAFNWDTVMALSPSLAEPENMLNTAVADLMQICGFAKRNGYPAPGSEEATTRFCPR
jgi:hypothetical protein